MKSLSARCVITADLDIVHTGFEDNAHVKADLAVFWS